MALLEQPVAWTIPTLREWLTQAAKHQRWLIPGFIPFDSLVLVSGQQKLAFKTWMADTIALALASGEEVALLDPVEAAPVLYCQEEGSHAGTHNRLMGLIRTHSIGNKALDNIHFAFHHRVKLDDPKWRARLVEFVVEHKIKLVILDALTYMHDGDENKISEMAPVVATLQDLRSAGTSVLFLAHLAKDAKRKQNIDTQVRGASIIVNAYDMHFALRRYRREDAHIDLTLRAREQEEREYTVLWDIVVGEDEKIEKASLSMTAINEESKLEAATEKCLASMADGRAYTAIQLRNTWRIGSSQAKRIREILMDEKKIVEHNGSYKLA